MHKFVNRLIVHVRSLISCLFEYVLCTHTLSLKSCTAVCCSLCLDFDSLYKQTKVLNTGQLHTVTMAAHISTHAIKLGELQKNSIAVLSAVNIAVHC